MAIDPVLVRATLLSWRVLGLGVLVAFSLTMFAISGHPGFLSIPAVSLIMLPVDIVRGYRRRSAAAESERMPPPKSKTARRK
jgi:hypothetical protein